MPIIKKNILSIIIFLSLILPAFPEQQSPPQSSFTPFQQIEFSYVDALILGSIEGITEYLPISSTAHLFLISKLIASPHHPSQQFVFIDNNNEIFLNSSPLQDTSFLYSFQDILNHYLIIIQLGAILAVLIFYWNRILLILRHLFQPKNPHKQLALHLIISFLPAAILGLLFHDFISTYLLNSWTIIISLITGSILMFYAEKYKAYTSSQYLSPTPIENLTPSKALFIGTFQCLSLIPGMSRSMSSIVAGYFLNLSPQATIEYTFLLGFITLSAASFYKILNNGALILQVFDFGPLLFGLFIAFIVGLLVIRWCTQYIIHKGLTIFIYYRLLFAGILLLIKFIY